MVCDVAISFVQELERKRNEAMQLELQAIERKKIEEEEERHQQRLKLLEFRRLKRLQDSKARQQKAEKLKKEEMHKKKLKNPPLFIKMQQKFEEKTQRLIVQHKKQKTESQEPVHHPQVDLVSTNVSATTLTSVARGV